MIVSAGFTAPAEGSTEASTINESIDIVHFTVSNRLLDMRDPYEPRCAHFMPNLGMTAPG